MSDDLFHGGAIGFMRRAFPHAPEPWLDLSTGVNPWPYPPLQASDECVYRLPTDERKVACRKAMADSIGVGEEHLILAPGSELLIRLLPTVLAPRRVCVLSPSYEDHKRVWSGAGCDEVLAASDPLQYASASDLVALCNPNNPDGRVFDPQALDAARRTLADHGGWLVVDEAYADLDPSLSLAPHGGKEGLIILRSFGKFFGLAGVRLGAMAAAPSVIAAISERLGGWAVSGAALEIGMRAYTDSAWQEETRRRLRAARVRLDSVLEKNGLNLRGGTDLFCYVECDGAHDLWERLARAGVYVRRFRESKRHLRIGLPVTKSDEDRLAAALRLST